MKTDQEQIIEILVQHESLTSAWHEPIDAVVRATGLVTMEARRYVEDLEKRGCVLRRNKVAHGPIYASTYGWVRPELGSTP